MLTAALSCRGAKVTTATARNALGKSVFRAWKTFVNSKIYLKIVFYARVLFIDNIFLVKYLFPN